MQWREWHDECGDCGSSETEILTAQTEDGWCEDGDQLRCNAPGCGATGSTCVIDEDNVLSMWCDKDGNDI